LRADRSELRVGEQVGAGLVRVQQLVERAGRQDGVERADVLIGHPVTE